MTPHSAATSYLTPTQFLSDGYVDPRWVADRLLFTGNRAGAIPNDPGGAVNVATVAALPQLQKILNRASGMLEAACLKGNRYQASDLALLAGTVAQDFLFGIIAGLAKGILMGVRPEPGVPLDPEYLQALDWLEQLAQGSRIFAFAEVQDAGIIADVVDTPRTVWRRNGVVPDARRFFGRRNNQEWWPAGGGW